jgi:hypothetical protein
MLPKTIFPDLNRNSFGDETDDFLSLVACSNLMKATNNLMSFVSGLFPDLFAIVAEPLTLVMC